MLYFTSPTSQSVSLSCMSLLVTSGCRLKEYCLCTASTPWACRRFHSPVPQSCQLPDPQRIVRHEYHSLPSAIVRFVVSPQAKTNRQPKCIISGVLAVFDASSEESLGTPTDTKNSFPFKCDPQHTSLKWIERRVRDSEGSGVFGIVRPTRSQPVGLPYHAGGLPRHPIRKGLQLRVRLRNVIPHNSNDPT